jgi:hypothetical protein
MSIFEKNVEFAIPDLIVIEMTSSFTHLDVSAPKTHTHTHKNLVHNLLCNMNVYNMPC